MLREPLGEMGKVGHEFLVPHFGGTHNQGAQAFVGGDGMSFIHGTCHSSDVLRVKDANKANGTPLVSYTPVNWKCVTWDFKHVEGQTYQLANLFTGKTFQPKEAPAEEVLLEEQPLSTGVANQQYEFLPGDNNSYWIRLKGTELYITPADDKGTTNSGILFAPKKAGALQTWTLQEQHPTM